jgi:AbrB family looped-hinge helix DNA binding protein
MRTTIDRAGRLVIPKPIRDEAGVSDGGEVEIEFRDGRIELEPVTAGKRLVGHGRSATIEAEYEMPTLTTVAVRGVLDRVRR